ncbi:MAG: GAF domain-containing protein [Methyloversatilis sp.]|nr:GAF domain-containing protein [Methyloversatilis sp.]MBP6194125.1 GAF domain-containing protein [Methyloversatilis sp.]MBP9117378.1 GAF domain-containing protein [Methyloversatilis sp.]
MNEPTFSPPFGQADLTNCERELIHLAGSIQPHGVLLVADATDLRVLLASENVGQLLGTPHHRVLDQGLATLGGNLAERVRAIADELSPDELTAFRCDVGAADSCRAFEGMAHLGQSGTIVIELEAAPSEGGSLDFASQALLATSVRRFSEALNITALADAVVLSVRELTGYDRVMVYRFDDDGHGEIIAEAREPRLESLLGQRYPATDIPQRARGLYLRNRVRVLADAGYTPSAVLPRVLPDTGEEFDMSMCHLRSMSPLHIQYLKNMGVTATLVVSLVREGRLWGLIACHHYSARHIHYTERAAVDLLAEVVATRIAAIENYVRTQVDVLVRSLELRLIEATSTEGDWRLALVRNPRTLLQPLEATGAALFHEGELLTVGDVPSTSELRSLADWVGSEIRQGFFSCVSVERANPQLESLTPVACGVLAIELSSSGQDFLMWFRREQSASITWAGDPTKPVVGNDPLTLSPRRSFAAWSEIVRGCAAPWSKADIALARAIGTTLRDVILQTQAVRLLIAQHQADRFRSAVETSQEPVLVSDAQGRVLFPSAAFAALFRTPPPPIRVLDDLADMFVDPAHVRQVLDVLRTERDSWRGEWCLKAGEGQLVALGIRADAIPGPGGTVLGYIIILTDLTDTKRTQAARRHLEQSLSEAGRAGIGRDPAMPIRREPDEVVGAILANASVAAMELTDTAAAGPVATLIEELEASATRAAAIYGKLRAFTRGN